jgi:hypothetical protein
MTSLLTGPERFNVKAMSKPFGQRPHRNLARTSSITIWRTG